MKKPILEDAVAKYKQGNKEKFSQIYDLTYKLVYFVALNIVKDKGIAEDIVQNTYIKVFEEIDKYENNNFLAWLTTIARNLSINEFNRRKRESTFEDLDIVADIGASDDFTQNFGLIGIAQNLLQQQDYEIVMMCVIAGYKRREVSQIMDIPISTVSFKLKTALNTLKQELSKEVNL